MEAGQDDLARAAGLRSGHVVAAAERSPHRCVTLRAIRQALIDAQPAERGIRLAPMRPIL